MRIDTRWATANAAEIRRHAAELAALAPDVILAHGTSALRPALLATRTVPIVFAAVADPVASGFVDSLARPGGNATGFIAYEFSLAGKWLELLKEIAPGITRAAVLRNAALGSGTSQLAVIQAVAPSLRVEVSPVTTRARSSARQQHADPPRAIGLLCARRERPRCRTAEQGDELAPPDAKCHLIPPAGRATEG